MMVQMEIMLQEREQRERRSRADMSVRLARIISALIAMCSVTKLSTIARDARVMHICLAPALMWRMEDLDTVLQETASLHEAGNLQFRIETRYESRFYALLFFSKTEVLNRRNILYGL